MMLNGCVVKGEQKAAKLYGLPTANLVFNEPLDLEVGVYTAFATINDGSTYPSIVCYSAQSKAMTKFEVHLFGFAGDLYGQDVEVEIEEKISEITRFTGEEAMKEKVLADVALAKEIFNII